jgi:hypothetical protein
MILMFQFRITGGREDGKGTFSPHFSWLNHVHRNASVPFQQQAKNCLLMGLHCWHYVLRRCLLCHCSQRCHAHFHSQGARWCRSWWAWVQRGQYPFDSRHFLVPTTLQSHQNLMKFSVIAYGLVVPTYVAICHAPRKEPSSSPCHEGATPLP